MAARERSAAAPIPAEPMEDDQNWRIRSELWNRRSAKITNQRAKRERPRAPLILCGHGVSLRIENGALAIRNGFTHYPQKQEAHRFFKGELAIPERIIMLDGSGSISFDVLSWLAEQDVSLIRIDWRGEVICVASRSALCRQSISGAMAARHTRRRNEADGIFDFENHRENRKFNFDTRKINSAQ